MNSQQIQQAFAQHLRNPDVYPAPQGIEDRRMQIYRDLIFKNILNFISNAFPVLRKLHDELSWNQLVGSFVEHHASRSPYFLSLGSEFLSYLESEHKFAVDAPPFFLELARYELVELTLFVSDAVIPDNREGVVDFLATMPQLSPLASPMLFEYPVHKIGPDFQPVDPEPAPICIVVYRNRADQVKFLDANLVTARLLGLCEEQSGRSARALLEQIAEEMQHPNPEVVIAGGLDTLKQLIALDIVIV